VAIAVTARGELAAEPEVEMTGIPETDEAGEAMLEAAQAAVMETLDSLPRARRSDPDSLAEAVRGAVRGAIAARWEKKPVCHVHVLTI
jgi:ribonuclease J